MATRSRDRTRQTLFPNLPLSITGNRLLAGGAAQVFVRVKNPLWDRKYRDLS